MAGYRLWVPPNDRAFEQRIQSLGLRSLDLAKVGAAAWAEVPSVPFGKWNVDSVYFVVFLKTIQVIGALVQLGLDFRRLDCTSYAVVKRSDVEMALSFLESL